ncbi:hypothetical protein NDU88_002525 [Pleurodeles waltl]|uniref:Uncharacterized protein n=1 Tax=Pleurodeles waltl TaxID=8319 RepID=A0AAV7KUF9_PLEWA|nr:hypothetical protein NDU88_002525 [Pleurodeles waltl]
MVWDPLKAGIIGEVPIYGFFKKRQKQSKIQELFREVSLAEKYLMQLLTKGLDILGVQKKIAILKAKANQYFSKEIAAKCCEYGSECYKYDENTGRLLAKRIREKEVERGILAMIVKKGRLSETPSDILGVFRDVYETFYTKDLLTPGEDYQGLFAGLERVSVTEQECAFLDATISVEN